MDATYRSDNNSHAYTLIRCEILTNLRFLFQFAGEQQIDFTFFEVTDRDARSYLAPQIEYRLLVRWLPDSSPSMQQYSPTIVMDEVVTMTKDSSELELMRAVLERTREMVRERYEKSVAKNGGGRRPAYPWIVGLQV